MPLRAALIAIALSFATPAFAQQASGTAPPALSAAQAKAAFEARGQAFQQSLATMQGEMQTALTAAGADHAAANANMDAILVRYQAQAAAFANELDAFVVSQLPTMQPEAQAQMVQMVPTLRAQIINAPSVIKGGLLQAAGRPSAAQQVPIRPIAAQPVPVRTGAAAADPLNEGKAAYERGDYRSALNLWRPLANQGDPQAIHNLATLYYEGRGVLRDYPEAARLFGVAARGGNPNSAMNLGYLYEQGHGTSQNFRQAAAWYAVAAASGVPEAENLLNSLQARGMAPRPYAQALTVSENAAAQASLGNRNAAVAGAQSNPDAQTCQRYGYAPGATGFADCMMQIDIARQAQARAAAEHNQRLAAYQQQVAQQERERRDERSMDMLMMGLRLMAGGSASGGSSGSAAPLPPPPQSTARRTIRLPNGNQIYCQTIGNNTTCN